MWHGSPSILPRAWGSPHSSAGSARVKNWGRRERTFPGSRKTPVESNDVPSCDLEEIGSTESDPRGMHQSVEQRHERDQAGDSQSRVVVAVADGNGHASWCEERARVISQQNQLRRRGLRWTLNRRNALLRKKEHRETPKRRTVTTLQNPHTYVQPTSIIAE